MPVDPDYDEYQDNPDWYGGKAKRKRDFSGRRGLIAPFAFGFLVALVMFVCGGLALLTSPLLKTFIAVQPIHTVSPTLTRTSTPTMTSTVMPTMTRTASPAANLTPLVAAQRRSGIFFYEPVGNGSWEIQTPPIGDYSLRGLHLDNYGNLYVAHTRGFDTGKPICDPQESYWVFTVNSYRRTDIIFHPTMTAPKRIAVDDIGNRYVIATDCVHAQPAIFRFDAQYHPLSTFSVVGADDIVALHDNRILVSLSGFPCTSESSEQQHLIVLQPNWDTNNWAQPVRGGSDSCDAVYHSMVVSGDKIYMIRSVPNHADTLMTFPIPPAEGDDYRPTATLALDDVGEPITDLSITKDNGLVGLGMITNSAIFFNTGKPTAKSFTSIKDIRSFTTAPNTHTWFYIGQSTLTP